MADLRHKKHKEPILVESVVCRKCKGPIVEVGETDFGTDDEGNVYGWIPDWECSSCGNYVGGEWDVIDLEN